MDLLELRDEIDAIDKQIKMDFYLLQVEIKI